jgi:probable HAF family extracellular repeat protein
VLGQVAIEDIGTLGGNESAAMGINAAGFIVGWSLTAAGDRHAFLWDPTTHLMTDLGVLAGYTESVANDLNDFGVIVGSSGPSGASHATRWMPIP